MISQDLQNKLINFSFVLFLLIPLSLISGPFLPDLFLVIIVIIFLFLMCFKEKYRLYKNTIFFLFIILFDNYSSVFIFFKYKLNTKRFILFSFRLFALAASVLIERKHLLNYILYLLLFIYLALFFDSIYQFKFNENILV